jgi:hypothetical protein
MNSPSVCFFSVYIRCGFYIPVENLVKSVDPSVFTHENNANPAERIDVEYIYGFVMLGGL